ncbi:MAG: glycosyl transferase [Frankiales bacterium]|nr:glycosyl transferase [Frankiales bacterium]
MTTLMTAPPAPAVTPAPARRCLERPVLAALLLGTALLYLWDLGASGYANSFYAQAVQAGTTSWKAMLFGSLDAGNAITVDKPAFFLWPMEISGRLFGFGSWSMLVPQALEGVATVALVHAAVKRLTGSWVWGIAAGAALALTPVAVLMFRFNNPDAMLVLLLTGGAYAVVRALERASARWLAVAGFLVGLGFITKMGQALLVVPAMGLAYLVAAPTGVVSRVRHLALSLVALVVGAGWWIALVTWWPGDRPWIGGSTDGTELDLAFGYNGLGRLFGSGQGNGGGGGMSGNAGFGGATGLGRLFRGDMATEASWLLPGALLALVLGLYLSRTAPRTDTRRAGLILLGGSLLVTVLVFSEMKGVIHPYYTIALAPLMAGVLAITAALVWERRHALVARLGAAAVIETTVLWDVHLLGSWQPAVKALVVIASMVAITALVWGARVKQLATVGLVAAVIAGLGGSAAYAVSTASHAHTGSIPSSGPVASSMGGGPGEGTTSNAALVALLKATTTTWAAATNGTGSSAPLQLASGKQVMAIGGFNGGDAAPTLAQFQKWVAEGKVSYYVSGGGTGGGTGGGQGGGQSGSGSGSIASWVAASYPATTVGGTTVYDLRTTS